MRSLNGSAQPGDRRPVRAHRAPLAHDTAGTLQTGTVRLSVSLFNTPREIDRTADVIENILKNSYKL